MTTKKLKHSAVALAGAGALASATLALGSQSDGAAQAAGATRTGAGYAISGRRDDHHDLSAAAKTLGVTEAKLHTALEQLRAAREDRERGDADAALAKSLGVSVERLRAAWDKLRAGHETAFATALAKALDLDVARVRSALTAVRGTEPGPGGAHGRRHGADGGRDAFATALAKRLGVSATRLRTALASARPDHDRRPARTDPAADLAKALGLDTAKVRTALERSHRTREDAFARALADKLGIDVAKVRSAADHLGLAARHTGDPAATAGAVRAGLCRNEGAAASRAIPASRCYAAAMPPRSLANQRSANGSSLKGGTST